MGDDVQRVRYAVPLTVVKMEGTVTVSTAANGEKVPMRTSEVTLATEADVHNQHELLLEPAWWKNRSFELKLGADGRLTGATDSSKGLGAEIVATGLRVAAFAAKAVAMFAVTIPRGVLQPEPIDEAFAEDHPELAERRAQVRATIEALQERVVSLADELAAPDATPATAESLKAVELAVAAARAEAARIESQFEAWRAKRFPDLTTSYTYTIGVDRLPVRDTAEQEIVLTDEELGEGQVGEALDALGVAVVRVKDRDPSQHTDDFGNDGVRYRLPRRCELAVYELPDGEVDPTVPTRLQLRRLTPSWIVDSDSEVGFIPFRSGVFEEHGAGAEFGEAGTLSRVTNKETGAASAISSAVGGAGAQVVESLEQAAKIQAAFPAATDPALKALQEQVARKELEAKLATAIKTIAEAGNGLRAPADSESLAAR